MILRTLAVGAAAIVTSAALAVPALASTSSAFANPETWSWGAIHSSDRAGMAKGKVVLDRPGFTVSGKLYDLPGRPGCSWAKFRWYKDTGGWGHKTYRNCSDAKPLSFTFPSGYMLKVEGKVCRGTAKKITGRCSGWEAMWAQGG
ncbi:hypothetical protein AB0L05_04610 [Nonomuraea pusilla]|uniref:hypothetical protein n=1 Tax=Nonomuraea pusilla TaxID=46177 RepID=UPI003327DE1F